MENVDRELVQKYFCGECTPEEAEQVLAWFRSPQGMRYLEEHIDSYNEGIRNRNTPIRDGILPEVADSKKMYLRIQDRIHMDTGSRKAGRNHRIKMDRRRNRNEYFLKATAAVLVMVMAGAGVWWLDHQGAVVESGEPEAMVYTTEQKQHQQLTLTDGTKVRLNENSSLIIPQDYNRGTRRVELAGEAFFDVEHNQDLPFEVIADEGFIRVLGTQFNVKTEDERHVQVAVMEGKVALSGNPDREGRESSSAILTKGYLGVYNFDSRETTIEETPVENYIYWITGDLVFEDTPLWQISRQLQWMYGTTFRYDDEEVRDLRLFASFPKDDLEEVLNIIASTLEIDYRMDDGEVIWKKL